MSSVISEIKGISSAEMIFPRIFRKQAVNIGQDDEQVRIDQMGHVAGQRIVVADANLIDGHRIVFIDNRE